MANNFKPLGSSEAKIPGQHHGTETYWDMSEAMIQAFVSSNASGY